MSSSPPPSPPPAPSRNPAYSFIVEKLPLLGLSPWPIVPIKIRDLVNGYCPFSFEKKYNIFKSLVHPYCTLCTVFNNKNLHFDSNWKARALSCEMQPLSSMSQLSYAVFRYAARGGSECLKSGVLIRCKNCSLIVHKLCYDIPENDVDANWLCDRCRDKGLFVTCEYCPLKGGVLKRNNKSVWFHPECKLLACSRSVSGTNESKRTCVVCNLWSGRCFRCSERGCNVWFHVSCGVFAGFNFRIDSHNERNILTRCDAHNI